MAIPRVFISSTWYDLKYIRENLRYFVRTLGYEPVLSEEGSVFYDPTLHTQDACITEIPTCQLFVLIIGGRFGGSYQGGENSITNQEYREAVKQKIPMFALVDMAVFNEHHVYIKNKSNDAVDLTKVNFPAVDSIKIFDFIDEVRGSAVNNALVPFRDFGDIESYLRQQWAGMMFEFLNSRNQQRKVADTLTTLAEMNSRIEMLSKEILRSVGTEDAKIDAALYEEMLATEAIRDLAFWRRRPTPVHVLVNSSFRQCAKALGVDLKVDETAQYSISGDGGISRPRFVQASNEYKDLRQRLIEILGRFGKTKEQYVTNHPVSATALLPEIAPAPAGGSNGGND